jgi:predicted GH43/DUF377 family glycosyl hydrolase
LFWQSSAGASRYEVYVDNVKIGGVPAAPVPVINYSSPTPFSVGSHSWFVKAISASGEAVASGNFAFTVEASTHWPAWAIGPFVRYGKNPILSPQGTGWESVNAFNPGAVYADGKFRMLYRAQSRGWPSSEGYAESTDGVTFVSKPNPVIDKTEPFEKTYGCEDARLFKLGDTYYAFYTGNDVSGHIAICEATSPDAVTWKKLGPVVNGTKNAAVVCDPHGTPMRINGKFVMYCGNSNFKISYSDDMVTWTPTANLEMKLPAGWVGPYEPCVAVTDPSSAHPDNIVLFIAGTLNGKGKWFYAISEVLFNKADLTKKVEQLDDCIMKPREPYESGQHPNCLWTNCIIQHNGQWYLYYGAGDHFVALATAPVKL